MHRTARRRRRHRGGGAGAGRYWPEFAVAGKARVTVGELLAHQAGLPAVDGVFADVESWADGRVAQALAQQAPAWTPGLRHGYHAITFGVLTDALVRCVDGRSLGVFFDEEIRTPLDAEFWIGLPEALEPRVVDLVAPAEPPPPPPWRMAEALADPRSVPARVWACSPWAADILAFNDPAIHRLELPAINGIGSARGLARMFGACVAEVDGRRIVSADTLSAFTTSRAHGRDEFAMTESHFGLGFHLPCAATPMAGLGSFGHDGRGGALAFGHAEHELGFGFITDHAPRVGGADPATQPLIAETMACLSRCAQR